MTGRFLWMLIGGIVAPTMLLVILVIQATVEREEWVGLRLERLQHAQVATIADQLGRWIERRADAALAEVTAAAGNDVDDAQAARRLTQADTSEGGVRRLFLLDRTGQVVWPQLPSPPLAQTLSAGTAPTYPVLLNPLHLVHREPSADPPARERYLEALEVYRPLLRQSDPWLRLVAADLMARSYTQLEEWPLALGIYEQMARDFGRDLDAGGVPIELGVRLEIANIHYRMGALARFLEGYLTVYERLVDRQYALAEEQRRYLTQITREALDKALEMEPRGHEELVSRLAEVRRREESQTDREAFIRLMWTHRVGEAIAAEARQNDRHYTVLEISGAPTTFFWRRAGERIAGLVMNPQVLLAELKAQQILQPQGEVQPVLRDLSGAMLVGEAEASSAVWGARIGSMPQWEVGVIPALLEKSGITAAFYLWLAVLAVAGLGGGIYGLARMMAGRLRTARLQADFASGVSHELRTPLTSIRMFSEMLLDGKGRDEGERRSYVETIRRESMRLERVVENVLSFTRSEKGGLPRARQPVDLAELTARVVEACRDAAAQQQVHLRLSAAAGLPAVWADPDSMESVVRNLLDNAVRYAGGGRSVEVQLAAGKDGGVVLSVADRGPGIPAWERRRIFQPFFRGQQGLRQAKSGTGLGLALVERIAKGHGGSVAVTPRPGGGSVFTVMVPAVGEQTEEVHDQDPGGR
ncbi:MAG: HAMP domain-containing sensor histidine kinase [Candidatus Latescibacterota bacterium]|jgi:signal transduction histidine kinase